MVQTIAWLNLHLKGFFSYFLETKAKLLLTFRKVENLSDALYGSRVHEETDQRKIVRAFYERKSAVNHKPSKKVMWNVKEETQKKIEK